MQHETETVASMSAKAGPPISVSLATLAGYDVGELLMLATLAYTLLLIGHKLWSIFVELRERRRSPASYRDSQRGVISRMPLAVLALSASALVGLAVHEGYRGEAYVPVPGDRPTIGFGDAQGVKMGQRTEPVRALIRLNAQADAFQRDMRACIGDVPLHHHEWDAYVSLTFNIGSSAFCKSTLVRELRKTPPDYTEACDQILRWDRFQGSRLPGLTKRRTEEHATCKGFP
jgi:lysozyme